MVEYVVEAHYGDQYRISMWHKTQPTGILVFAVMSIIESKLPHLAQSSKKVGTVLSRITFNILSSSTQSKL